MSKLSIGWKGEINLDVVIILIATVLTIGAFCDDIKTGAIALLTSLIIIGGVVGFQFWYFKNTASGNRAMKSQESELQNGIVREVKVYDVNGKVIQEYEGKFDIKYDESRILFDDENGKRHTIYYSTGTIIIDEK